MAQEEWGFDWLLQHGRVGVKVVRRDPETGKLTSILMSGDLAAVYSQSRSAVRPGSVPDSGPLTAFDSLLAARNYVEKNYSDSSETLEFYRCKYAVSHDRAIWSACNPLAAISLSSLPAGTVLCDSLVLTERIDVGGKEEMKDDRQDWSVWALGHVGLGGKIAAIEHGVKVVRYEPTTNRCHSVSAGLGYSARQYTPGCIVEPRGAAGPLTAFETLADARYFYQPLPSDYGLRYYKCEYVRSTQSSVWVSDNSKVGVYKSGLPKGTVLCDALMITEQIDIGGKEGMEDKLVDRIMKRLNSHTQETVSMNTVRVVVAEELKALEEELAKDSQPLSAILLPGVDAIKSTVQALAEVLAGGVGFQRPIKYGWDDGCIKANKFIDGSVRLDVEGI